MCLCVFGLFCVGVGVCLCQNYSLSPIVFASDLVEDLVIIFSAGLAE